MARSPSGDSVLARVDRVLAAFDTESSALTVAQIARRATLPIATAHRLVAELTGLGYLERAQDNRVRLGVRLWELGSRGSRTLGLRQAALPFLETVQAVVRQHTQLAVLQGIEALFLERLSGRGAVVNITKVAGRLPVHACSSGLVLLANAPRDTQERILRAPLRGFTVNTVTDPVRLRRLLADIRRHGFVVADRHIIEDATGLAVPIRGSAGQVVAALNVVVPSGDDPVSAHLPVLLAAANGISRAVAIHR